jgi:hypothetical protein
VDRPYEYRHKTIQNFGLVVMKNAEIFAAHLSKVLTPNENHPDPEIEDDITTLN